MNVTRSAPARAALLEAGADLADERGLAILTVDAVVDRAGTGKGTFYRYFGDQAGYLMALHGQFTGKLRRIIEEQAVGIEPGADRLMRMIIGCLDACLGQAGLKAFLTEARVIPAVAESVQTFAVGCAEEFRRDYRAMNWPHPSAAARLAVAMAHETALAEHERGGPDPNLRATLRRMATRRTNR